ncbi:MAG TPA: PQQ-binding-like beta-propeller repeat protein [Candidatus Acidoferrum sp.]|nr:PQQ-binding-like beta-propeller repeat protein [Candidatus Acidoferrum sp.]
MATSCPKTEKRIAAICALVFALTCISAKAQEQGAAKTEGEAIYRDHCASCHEGQVTRAPVRSALTQMARQDIRIALTTGNMRTQAANLTPEQIDALARFLSDREAAPEPPPLNADMCPAEAPAFAPQPNQPHWNGWGVDVTQHRFQPEAMARLSADQVPQLKLKWAFGYQDANQAYAQPTIVGGRIFVGSVGRRVYSINAKTGCIYWEVHTDFPVRTAITISALGSSWAAYFGDQHGNVYAADAVSGNILWKTSLDPHQDVHVTGAPTLAEGKLFVGVSSLEEVSGADAKDECCTFRGSLSALDASTGKVIWKSYTIADEPRPAGKNKNGVQLWGPSGAAIWSSPTIDLKKHLVYVTTGDNYSDPPTNTSDAFMAFDMATGKLAWSNQMTHRDAYNVDCDLPAEKQVNCPASNGPDFDFGSSAILVDLPNGRRALVAGAKSGIVYAVDPDRRGKLLWQQRVGRGGTLGGVQWGSAADAERIYVAVSDVQRRPAAAESLAGRASVYGVPYELDPKIGGGLFALKLDTGEIAWHMPHPGCDRPGCSPAQSAAVTAIPGVVFSGGVDGHLRAYSMKDGKIIWDVDTQREYTTLNGVKASGGSLDEAGAVIVDGMLYVNSGYFFQGSTAGNVLLAFSVDGK